MRDIRNCNVCVTGGAGFLGSHMVRHLIEDRGCKVMVIDNLCAGRREFIHPKAAFEHADITCSEDYLRGLLGQYEIEYTFSYAAHPYVPLSYSRPLHVFETNATGAIKVINAAQAVGCKGILQVSSAELYGDAGRLSRADADDPARGKLTEESTVRPHSTYGAAKAAVDYYCQCAWKERQTPVLALRQFNCCGPRETHPYIVPEVIGQLSKYDKNWPDGMRQGDQLRFLPHPVTVRLGNNTSRDLMYAGDAVRIAVELLERGEWGQVYNLGSEEAIKVYDLAKLIGEVMGFKDVTVEHDPARDRAWDIEHLQSNNSKIYGAIGTNELTVTGPMRTLTPLRVALERTVKWHEEQGRKWPWEK